MPSKLKKAIAAVKDQTSISLAKVGGTSSSSLEVAILKATTHDEGSIDERYVIEVLQHVSSNKSYARSCARAIGRRVGRTKNWVVAVKSLMLVLRIFQDGDPHFPKEVLHAMKRGYKILNLTTFRDESTTSCPWDFTSFVRSFALYLDERLDCFITGKLQRRTSSQQSVKSRGYSKKIVPFVRDMKPGVLLDRITHWQRLLDRAIAAQPTGAAMTNSLVKTCLYAIVQETFELYRDISDGLSILLDGFFHLQYNNCVIAFQTCGKASKQFEELGVFHHMCQSIGVGRASEYPNVQKISDELLETLQEFLKDQSSFTGTTPEIRPSLPPLSPKLSDIDGSRDRSVSMFGGAHCTSLEDLITTDPGFSPDRYSDPGRENPSQGEEFFDEKDDSSVRSDPTDHRGISSVLDLLSLDAPSPPPEFQDPDFETADNIVSTSLPNQDGWELVLFDNSNQHVLDLFSNINENAENDSTTKNYSNPFLEATTADPTEGDLFGSFTQTSFSSTFSEGGFPGDLGLVIENNTAPEFKADFGDNLSFSSDFTADFGSEKNSFVAPTFQSEASTNNRHQSLPVDLFGEFGNATDATSTSNSHQSLPVIDLFGEFGNAPDDFSHSAAFSADFGDPPANDMNAIVSFSPAKNDDFFASGRGFQAAPTFRANSVDIDNQESDLGVENDPFGAVTAMPAVEQQQQLWLQNQNKILARHLT